MRDFVAGPLKDQAIAFLFGLITMYWIDPTSTEGKVFTIIVVVALVNGIIQFFRWLRPGASKAKKG